MKNMKNNKINFAHKSRLLLFNKITRENKIIRENEEKHTNLELSSFAVVGSKELQRRSFKSKEK